MTTDIGTSQQKPVPSGRRCLIVERHEWETGGRQQQLQLVLEKAEQFFGPGSKDKRVHVRVFMPSDAPQPTFERDIVISREYANGTRRVNGFPEIGQLGSCFIFFEETDRPDVYDVWWELDKAIVAAKYTGWQQGKSTQYGRGRLSVIVDAPVQRAIRSLQDP